MLFFVDTLEHRVLSKKKFFSNINEIRGLLDLSRFHGCGLEKTSLFRLVRVRKKTVYNRLYILPMEWQIRPKYRFDYCLMRVLRTLFSLLALAAHSLCAMSKRHFHFDWVIIARTSTFVIEYRCLAVAMRFVVQNEFCTQTTAILQLRKWNGWKGSRRRGIAIRRVSVLMIITSIWNLEDLEWDFVGPSLVLLVQQHLAGGIEWQIQ